MSETMQRSGAVSSHRELLQILDPGPEHDLAQTAFRARNSQLAAMGMESLPVVALRIEHAASWGRRDRE